MRVLDPLALICSREVKPLRTCAVLDPSMVTFLRLSAGRVTGFEIVSCET